MKIFNPYERVEKQLAEQDKILHEILDKLSQIHAYGVWVACIKLSDKEPYILLADHIEKKDMMLIYRVNNLNKVAYELRLRGWREEKSLEIPNGPCKTFRDPADNAIVMYENRRPHVMEEFKGRIDNE